MDLAASLLAAQSRNTAGGYEGEWQEFVVGAPPEGLYLAAYCVHCQVKNRWDEGWRFRTNEAYAAQQAAFWYRYGPAMGVLNWAVLEYECGYCRGDKAERAAECEATCATAAKKKRTASAGPGSGGAACTRAAAARAAAQAQTSSVPAVAEAAAATEPAAADSAESK